MAKEKKNASAKSPKAGGNARRVSAADTLLDRNLLSVDTDAYAELIKRLDAPVRPNKRLRRTMQAKTLWN